MVLTPQFFRGVNDAPEVLSRFRLCRWSAHQSAVSVYARLWNLSKHSRNCALSALGAMLFSSFPLTSWHGANTLQVCYPFYVKDHSIHEYYGCSTRGVRTAHGRGTRAARA